MGINGSSWAAGFHSHGDNGFQVERSAYILQTKSRTEVTFE